MIAGYKDQQVPERRTSGFIFAAGLALALLLCSLLPAITGGLWGRFGEQVLNTALAEPLWRMRLGLNIGLFALALLALHLCFGGLCWIMGVASQDAWHRLGGGRRQWILLWFIVGTFWLLTANAAWFPNTMLGFPYHGLATKRALGLSMFAWVTIGLAGIALATLSIAVARTRYWRLAIAMAALGAAAISIPGRPNGLSSAPAYSRPNVILIGIDSLRIDGVDPMRMPNVHAFLAGAAVADDAITPLARTFPAWASILTGRGPHTTGAFMNLLPRSQINPGETLPATLRKHGYRTAYAIDETRFSNIDTSYGFDQVVTPGIGASDFVLGTFADLPLLNLVVNTRIGGWLFPHVHSNRAASSVYEPATFIRRLDRELSYDKPLFLAVHLTLPHWPYTWATSSLEPQDGATQRGHYLDTLRRVDAQFADLLQVLENRGVLHNALVVALSDHGQAFADDEVLAKSSDRQLRGAVTFDTEGHGTSVFSPMQYRVVLGFRGYGAAKAMVAADHLRTPASLLDIAPTVVDLLHIPTPGGFEGISLAAELTTGVAPHSGARERIRFTETEYAPVTFSETNMTGSAIASAARAYRIDPVTDRVFVRVESLEQIMRRRQYAAFLGDRAMAAAVPDVRKDGRRQLVFVPYPFAGEPLADEVNAADRQTLKSALERTFSLAVADPEDPPR